MTARILIVEDEDNAREALAELLRDEGYQVATAAGGRAAMASVADAAPDLVLSDVRMPQGDGIELVRNLRAWPATARVPVVLMSAYTDAERRVAGLDSGADDFVAKPVDLGELLARIRVQLRRLEEREQLERRAAADPVTGLPNRRAIVAALQKEAATAAHDGHPLSLLMLDIDRFRALNLDHGHQVGDTVLRHVARALQEATHDDSHVGRWGGDEFVVIIPGADEAVAAGLAARLRRRKLPLVAIGEHGGVIVQVSVGVATLRPNDSATALLARAEQDLNRTRTADAAVNAPGPHGHQ